MMPNAKIGKKKESSVAEKSKDNKSKKEEVKKESKIEVVPEVHDVRLPQIVYGACDHPHQSTEPGRKPRLLMDVLVERRAAAAAAASELAYGSFKGLQKPRPLPFSVRHTPLEFIPEFQHSQVPNNMHFVSNDQFRFPAIGDTPSHDPEKGHAKQAKVPLLLPKIKLASEDYTDDEKGWMQAPFAKKTGKNRKKHCITKAANKMLVSSLPTGSPTDGLSGSVTLASGELIYSPISNLGILDKFLSAIANRSTAIRVSGDAGRTWLHPQVLLHNFMQMAFKPEKIMEIKTTMNELGRLGINSFLSITMEEHKDRMYQLMEIEDGPKRNDKAETDPAINAKSLGDLKIDSPSDEKEDQPKDTAHNPAGDSDRSGSEQAEQEPDVTPPKDAGIGDNHADSGEDRAREREAAERKAREEEEELEAATRAIQAVNLPGPLKRCCIQ